MNKRFRRIILIIAVFVCVFLFFSGALFFAFTPYALCQIWLPAIARSAGVSANAEKIRLISLVPFRIEAADFHYTDSDVGIRIAKITTGLPLGRLKKHEIELHETQIKGLRIRCFGKSDTPVTTSVQNGHPSDQSAAGSSQPWKFSMRKFKMEDAVFEYENTERKVVQVWSVKTLAGDQFLTGEVCSATADSSLRMYSDKQNPLEIRSLQFRIRAEYMLDPSYTLKTFSLDMKTGICDFAIPGVIDVTPAAGIRASCRMSGSFPDPETFRILHSEIKLFKGSEGIGKLQLKGETARRFQYEGKLSDLDLQPYLRLMAPDSQVSSKLSRAEFTMTGTDFSPEGIRKDLKARVIARMDQMSIPIQLNRNNRLIRLVMIPLEAVPSFLELIYMKWNLQREYEQCVNSIQAVISGRQNLNFDQADLDLSMENGILLIRNFTLHGRDIEMESIRGTLELATEKLDIRTVLVVSSLKLPLQFKGTLSEPSPHFKEAIKDFVLLNTPLLQKLESLFSEPPSTQDSQLEKAIKRGYRDLQHYIR